MMLYNSQTVETITGEVVSVDRIAPMKGMSYGVHVKVKTATETIPVHLGPAWFLDPQETHILKGDKVTVIGSRVDYQGKPAIIAAEVKKGEDTFRLRDENGFPAWSGWRRQQMQMKQP
ncbi:MAG: DNA-binding protein [Chlorobiales bacterium]|nr:DNA-binding protein [Chlorobiales bacterium]